MAVLTAFTHIASGFGAARIFCRRASSRCQLCPLRLHGTHGKTTLFALLALAVLRDYLMQHIRTFDAALASRIAARAR